VIGSGCEAAG